MKQGKHSHEDRVDYLVEGTRMGTNHLEEAEVVLCVDGQEVSTSEEKKICKGVESVGHYQTKKMRF